ncbi:MAG TPA: zf-HC2 domain-containing protein [Verrucomicrobiae bacterium]|nr:zf-HC2 domain-containing protein [Verrucomicrobiae bacterium]
MRCSSCEILLDRYVEGTLSPARMLAVRAHLERCPACQALHRELRVVDGLLATMRPVQLAPNFTFAVMAEARALPAPLRRNGAIWPAVAIYLTLVWAAAALAALAGAGSSFGRQLGAGWHSLGGILGALAGAAHAIGPIAPIAAGVVVAVLAADALLVAAVVLFYRLVRPQLAARLAASREAP